MALTKKPIKLSVASEILGISASAIRQGKAGTKDLTLFTYPDSPRLYVYENEVRRLAESRVIVREKGKRIR